MEQVIIIRVVVITALSRKLARFSTTPWYAKAAHKTMLCNRELEMMFEVASSSKCACDHRFIPQTHH